jgi:hypothetical protein
MLTQVQAARVMYAAEKWVSAAEILGMGKATYTTQAEYKAHDRAKQAFADLIETLTTHETGI